MRPPILRAALGPALLMAAGALGSACRETTGPGAALPITPGRYVLRSIDGIPGPPWGQATIPSISASYQFDTLRIRADSTFCRHQLWLVSYSGGAPTEYRYQDCGDAIPEGSVVILMFDDSTVHQIVRRDPANPRGAIVSDFEDSFKVWELDSLESSL